jgi:hypothetical protein
MHVRKKLTINAREGLFAGLVIGPVFVLAVLASDPLFEMLSPVLAPLSFLGRLLALLGVIAFLYMFVWITPDPIKNYASRGAFFGSAIGYLCNLGPTYQIRHLLLIQLGAIVGGVIQAVFSPRQAKLVEDGRPVTP